MTKLNDDQKNRLLDIADVLVPKTDRFPSLRVGDPDGEWLERALYARNADAEINSALERIDSENVEKSIRELHACDRRSFDVISEVVAGTYYMLPSVQDIIGYHGQERRPPSVEEAADELSDEIFNSMLEYPGSFREPTNRPEREEQK